MLNPCCTAAAFRPVLNRVAPWRVFDPCLLAVHFALGIWLLQTSPDPPIDVAVVHEQAIRTLLAGENPYAMTFPNIYPDTSVYAPELVVDGRVQFGFPYPPFSLLLAVPGQVLFGDYRYSNLAALTATGALIGYSTPAAASRLAAAIFLFTPRVFFVLEQGWTEPMVVLLLAATVACATQARRWTFAALGALLAVKQYLVLGAPLVVMLVQRTARPKALLPLCLKAAAVAAVLTLPFVVWDGPAFLRSVVMVQVHEPFRRDSLSYVSLLVRQGQPLLPTWAGVVLAVATLGVVLWRSPRHPGAFAAGLAAVTFVFFAFGKKAFCNYYFFVIGALCCAAALSWDEGRAARPARPVSAR